MFPGVEWAGLSLHCRMWHVVVAPPEMMCLLSAAPHSFSVTCLCGQGHVQHKRRGDQQRGIDDPLSDSESLQTTGTSPWMGTETFATKRTERWLDVNDLSNGLGALLKALFFLQQLLLPMSMTLKQVSTPNYTGSSSSLLKFFRLRTKSLGDFIGAASSGAC